mmetsp:Transcript_102889/g.300199  ORF Transcript_102889/g.300199 Transcript_102889/m.300199 type:complete len:632 (+) Transcript_102889:81-1976(+)
MAAEIRRTPLGESAWESLDRQIELVLRRHSETQKAVELLGQEQTALLMHMRSIARSQAQVPLCLAESQSPTWTAFPPIPEQRASPLPRQLAVKQRDVGEEEPNGSWSEGTGIRKLKEKRRPWDEAVSPEMRVKAVPVAQATQEKTGPRKTSFPKVELSHYQNQGTRGTLLDHDTDSNVTLPPLRDGIRPWIRAWAGLVLRWGGFEPMMGIIIALNAANIGWTIDSELRGLDTTSQEIIETVFLGIFVLELSLRLFVKGMVCLKIWANLFDFALVLITVMTQVVKPLLEYGGGEDVVMFLQQVMVLRMMRLLRLARAVRLVASFRGLWKLAQGLCSCLSTMLSAFLLMFIFIFIFACFGAEFITKVYLEDDEVGHIIRSRFSSLPSILLTLFQFVSMDSTAQFYVPVVLRSPALSIYFLLLLCVVAIALMNLITAMLVEDAISSAQMDEEMKLFYARKRLRQLTPSLRHLFQSLDKNGDGLIQIREVVESIKVGIQIPVELQDIINPARMLDLFEALDSDSSGDLSEPEFVDGLCYVALADIPRETMQMLHLLRSLRKDFRRYAFGNADIQRLPFECLTHAEMTERVDAVMAERSARPSAVSQPQSVSSMQMGQWATDDEEDGEEEGSFERM